MTDQRPTLNYGININAKNMFVRAYVNGAPILSYARFDEFLFSMGVNNFLKPGANQIVIDYEPFDMEKQSFTPHEGVVLEIKLDRQTNQEVLIDDDGNISVTRPDLTEEVDLFSGRYNVETGQMRQTLNSAFNQRPLVRQDGGLVVPDTFESSTITTVSRNRTSEGHAQRLTFTFYINDVPMPTPPWINAAPLSDTPEFRAELWQAYQQMHRIIATRDEPAYRKAMQVLFSHLALTTGYRDADQFADVIIKKRPFKDTPKKRVAPLAPAATVIGGHLEFGPGQQMVRFFPDPIRYETGNGDPSGSHGFFFCRHPEGHLVVCHVKQR